MKFHSILIRDRAAIRFEITMELNSPQCLILTGDEYFNWKFEFDIQFVFLTRNSILTLDWIRLLKIPIRHPIRYFDALFYFLALNWIVQFKILI